MDYILFILFTTIGWCLLIGMTEREKKWIGGIGAVLLVVFILVSQMIKIQSGFFENRTVEASEAVGTWVVPCFVVLGLYLLGMMNFRWMKLALKQSSWVKWGLIISNLLFSLVYLWFGGFVLFVVAFTYFPFAP